MEREHEPFILEPGEARRFPQMNPSVKLGEEDTGGLATFAYATLPPGAGGPPLHIHTREDEGVLVVAGELTVQLGDERRTLTEGMFAWMPRDVAHTFSNLGSEPVRAAVVFTPAGCEKMLAELDANAGRSSGAFDVAAAQEIVARYGCRFVGPPIHAAHAR